MGSKITSTGTIAELSPGNSVRRKISQTAVISDGVLAIQECSNSMSTQEAYVQEDWAEIAP